MNRIHYDFSGTTTVITGGSSGIGLASAVLIAKSGWNVIVSASRNPEKTTEAVSQIEQAAQSAKTGNIPFVKSFPYQAENEESVRSFFENVSKTTKRVDFLIHSAGISPDTDYNDQDANLWNKVLAVNTTGTHLATKYVREIMKKQTIIDEVRWKMVLITSTNGVDSYGIFSAAYDASKAATNNMVRNLGEDFHRTDKIIINGLAPGWIDTELNNTLPEEARKEESAKIWSERFATPEEMAYNAAALLTLPYRSGRFDMVDGGYR
jgi:3-oxoacyl-[acyl-carrier protein] reductase